MATSILTHRHKKEQLTYVKIREAVSEEFLADPVLFVGTHGKRPEDFRGEDLREYYYNNQEVFNFESAFGT